MRRHAMMRDIKRISLEPSDVGHEVVSRIARNQIL